MTWVTANVGLALAALAAAAIAPAAAAPSQLANKTITVSWTATASGTAEDGSPITRPLVVQRVIYVSSKGRVFVRSNRSAGNIADSSDKGPEVTGGTYRVEGGRIVGFSKMQGGAVQIAVTFDSSLQSCSLNVQVGRSSNEPYKTKAPNGKIYTLRGTPSLSAMNCSIRDGNPFGE